MIQAGTTRRSKAAAIATRVAVAAVVLACAVLATYANHFSNGFHFDDSHTVVDNPYIRDIHNIPQLFRDARTSTPRVQNQIFRPLVSVSLAVDYWIGGGLKPFWFHFSTFCWYLVLLAAMYFFYLAVMDRAAPETVNQFAALFAVAWFGLHPVSAETVNYVYQRGDLYASLWVVVSFVVFARWPTLRRRGV